MAFDGSLASNLENWMQTTIAALDTVPTGNCDLFGGVPDLDAKMSLLQALQGERSPFVAVENRGFRMVELEEGDKTWIQDFSIWIVVHNLRGTPPGAAARVGEAGTPVVPGTNLLAEQIRHALHSARPDCPSTLIYPDKVTVESGASIYDPKGTSIVELKCLVRCNAVNA